MSARSIFTLAGHAADHAKALVNARSGEWSLHVDVELPPTPGSPKHVIARVVQRYGQGPAAAIACRRRAQQLRKGVRVSAQALGVRLRAGRIEIEPLAGLSAEDIDGMHNRRYFSDEAR